jgi:EpsI family protein
MSRGNKWLLGILFVLAALSYRELFTWNFSSHKLPNYVGWFFNLSDTAPQFHYLLAVGLFYIGRKDIIQAFQEQGAPWSATLFLLPGAVLLMWGRYVNASDIVYLSLLLVALGTARFLSGKNLTRAILLPILILVLALPLPAVLVNQIVFPFQLWTAEHIAWLLNLVGIPSQLVGDVIQLADQRVRVAESCTALGFIKWLLVIAIAYAYIFRVSRLHAITLILSAPLIAYAVNLLRAFSLVLNPGLEVLEIHLVQGIAFFMLGFSLLYAVDSIILRFARRGEDRESERQPEKRQNTDPCRKHTGLVILIFFYFLLLVLSLTVPRWSDPYAGQPAKLALPERLDDWKVARTQPLNRMFLGNIRYSSYIYRVYVRDSDRVSLFIGYDDRRRRDRSMLSAKNAYPDDMGRIEKRTLFELDTHQKTAESILTNTKRGRFLVYHWQEGIESIGEEMLRGLLALDQSPWRRPAGALVFRVATPVAPTSQGEREAEQRLRDFISDLGERRRKR